MEFFVARIGFGGPIDIRPGTAIKCSSSDEARSKRDQLNDNLGESDDEYFAFVRRAGIVQVLS